MEMMSLQLKDALLEIFKQNANKLQEIDESILKSLGANVIFKDYPKDIIEEIMLIKDVNMQVYAFQYLIKNFLLSGSFSYINLYAYNNTKIRSYDPTDILMSSWWDVIWPHGFNRRNNTGYIMLQYKYSGKLLCLVELKLVELSFSENYVNPSCHWLITYATEDEIKSGCGKPS
ncbi:hypothetical protein FF38_07542 [Lucilia cuprina]|uniref:Uncharacterized protein n=1 Tax=Lucilia cuprina TaxID=7375 RepID=A0A0L0C243_LUCCU|nr:hypothetical protein FF38_07542 [Lucilia cuprina]